MANSTICTVKITLTPEYDNCWITKISGQFTYFGGGTYPFGDDDLHIPKGQGRSYNSEEGQFVQEFVCNVTLKVGDDEQPLKPISESAPEVFPPEALHGEHPYLVAPKVIGNRKTTKYHLSTGTYYKQMLRSTNAIAFSTEAEAKIAGYKPASR